ncbi:MAG TPA: recombinase family protein [Pyrinomonadaceae bacterium]|jgi:site-specific DNA recombinase|nr:recombinase family protein [Pyrinomonadaceae bacterium]
MKPFIPYARVSSDEQKDAETIKTQIAEVEQHARTSQLPLAEWVTDDGVSGVIPFHERAGGARVLELLRTGQFAGVACLNHKRIGRDAYVIHLAVRQIEQELGGDIQAIREPVPSQIAPGARALMRAMYAGVAQYDREELLAAMRAGKLRAAKEGRWAGGNVPFGLKLEICRVAGRAKPVKRLVHDEVTKGLVVELFTLYAAGHSQQEIARIFNARGVSHPTGERWQQGAISYMLSNPVYKGEGSWRRRYEAKNKRGGKSKYKSPPENLVRYEDYQVPAIVSPELWERCAHLRRMNTKLAPRNARHLYLLRGLVRCGVCGRGFTGVSNQQRWFYYQCNSRSEPCVTNCGNRRVRAFDLEQLVWSEIARFAASPGKVIDRLRRTRVGRKDSADSTGNIERQIAAKQRELTRVITWAREGRITESELDTQLVQVRAEMAVLEQERVRIEAAQKVADAARTRLADVETFLSDLAGRLETLSDAARANVMRQLVPRVVVTPREDGRVGVAATYAFSPPPYTWNCPASSNCLT